MIKKALESNQPVITILALAVVVLAVVVGGIVTITNPDTLSFQQYAKDITTMGAALGLGAGIGRGIESAGSDTPPPESTTTEPDPDNPYANV